ncbi:MAG: hypothetical protein NTV56_14630 [Alphaproteobacteria bacterium]|nr:hypothetical protein [Alphaproteobacteria bacterium]
MRRVLSYGAALVLLGSFGAMAQNPSVAPDPSVKEAQQQSFPAQPQTPAQDSSTAGTIPPPPLSQPQAPIADQAAPAAVGPAQANTTDGDGTDHAIPLGATRQTMPSTISKENAALDKLSITQLQLPLTEEQKRSIARSVAATPKTQPRADMANVHLATFLPIGTPIKEFSEELKQQVTSLTRYKYVALNDRVLIVDPSILTVVGEITL